MWEDGGRNPASYPIAKLDETHTGKLQQITPSELVRSNHLEGGSKAIVTCEP